MSNKPCTCGRICKDCPAYKATISKDKEVIKEAAKILSKQYKTVILPEDVHCLGCHQTEVLFGFCEVCQIRRCAKLRSIESCAYCLEFPCPKLNFVFDCSKEAKLTLKKLREEQDKSEKVSDNVNGNG